MAEAIAVHLFPRLAQVRLEEALAESPVVLLYGPRQCGKSTLAKQVGEAGGYRYLSFDDELQLASVRADPAGFVDDLPERVVLDEIQRVPGLFLSLKAAVDRDRRPGRFLLTGSANMLLLPRLADSLAGRLELVRLYPLCQAELAQTRPDFLERLFGAGFPATTQPRLGKELAQLVADGGYPEALARPQPRRRATWYRDYLETLVQRDARELGRIQSLDALPRLLALAATQTARLVQVTELAAPFQLSRPTIRDYLTLLTRLFLLEELPPWHSNRLSRLIKTPKLHLGDTGLACALLGMDAETLWADRTQLGPLLETFVFQELRRQAGAAEQPATFHHFRDRDGAEVDLVLERGGRVAGVEIKAGATVTAADFRGLRMLREAAGERFARGVVLYDGQATAPFGAGLQALPIRRLWETD